MTNRVDVLILEGLESWESLSTWLGTKYLKLTETNKYKYLKHLLLLVAQILRSFIEMGVAHNQLTSTKVLILAAGDSFNVKIIDFITGTNHARMRQSSFFSKDWDTLFRCKRDFGRVWYE